MPFWKKKSDCTPAETGGAYSAAAPDRRTRKQQTGDAGEDAALAYLQQRGMVLVERNFRCPGGEIDLILRDRDTLVFVEVRSRASARFGGALASITPAKQRKLWHAAQVYLVQFSAPPACRFDVIAIEAGTIHWLPDAMMA